MKPVSELDAQLEATDEFIQANPVAITLIRTIRTRDETGGFTETDEDLWPQDFVIIGPTGREVVTQSVVGEMSDYTFQLKGYHDADIQKGDSFTLEGGFYGDSFSLEGGFYRVTFVFPERAYRTLAYVKFARGNTDG